jgi:hypothetical protein
MPMQDIPLGMLSLVWFIITGSMDTKLIVSFGWSMLMLGVKFSKLPLLKAKWTYRNKQMAKLEALYPQLSGESCHPVLLTQ